MLASGVKVSDQGRGNGLRERFRTQVRDEVKLVALRQLAEQGPQGVSVNAIAKALRVSGPALYRYFASRDELLAELVLDAYHDLARALDEAGRSGSPAERLLALARAYREWAIAQPHRYRLLFAAPVPGFDAHAERLVEAAQQAMVTLVDTLAQLPPAPGTRPPASSLAHELAGWAGRRELVADPATSLRAVTTWARLHGLVSLEIEGNFASMGVDAAALYEHELAALLG